MSGPERVDLAGLSSFPLPDLGGDVDKHARGQVLAVAGGARAPGAAVLSGIAALRAGAGKLQLAATPALAGLLGLSAPEAGIIVSPAAAGGEFAASASDALLDAVGRADAVVVGPGMFDEDAAAALATALLAASETATFVLDAAAMTGFCRRSPSPGRPRRRLVLAPHPGEMARIAGLAREDVAADPLTPARELAASLGAVVVMKGPDTHIVTPDGRAWRHQDGVVGLATAGSGDVLAGLIAGFAARGASPATAALWGVCVHAAAGARLTERLGPLGFLARELLPEAPSILASCGQSASN
jgi:ADP-dependent NAD(P)H-hydrate dehydratase